MATPRLASRFNDEHSLALGTQPTPSAPKSEIWNMLTAFTAFATLVLARGQTDRIRFWGMVGVAVFILAIGLYRPAMALWRRLALRRHNRGVARKYRQEFRRLTFDAGHFMTPDISYTDTVAAAIGDIQQRFSTQPNNALLLALTNLPPLPLFSESWGRFNTRIQKDSLTTEQFHAAVDELIGIVRTFNSHFLYKIFHTFAAEYREVLSEGERSHFNAVQQGYRAYVERLYDFVNRLNDEFRGLPELSATMGLPKPL